MRIAEVLLEDFDIEMKGTRTTLERIPNNPDFRLHPKSMAMGRLAVHVATLCRFGITILTTPELAFDPKDSPPLVYESTEKLLAEFDTLSAELRAALASCSDEWLDAKWKMTFGDYTIADEKRSILYRTMFFNHLIHHRAQLGVYLRLSDVAVPPLYGPSADEMGF